MSLISCGLPDLFHQIKNSVCLLLVFSQIRRAPIQVKGCPTPQPWQDDREYGSRSRLLTFFMYFWMETDSQLRHRRQKFSVADQVTRLRSVLEKTWPTHGGSICGKPARTARGKNIRKIIYNLQQKTRRKPGQIGRTRIPGGGQIPQLRASQTLWLPAWPYAWPR